MSVSYKHSKLAGTVTLLAIFTLISVIVYQEIETKNKFNHLEYNQMLIIHEVNQYLPAVKQLIDDDKKVFENEELILKNQKEFKEVTYPKMLREMEELKQMWDEHIHPKNQKPQP